MKKFIYAILVVVALGALVFLSSQGVIPGWQVLTMLGAAIAAPFKLLMNLFGDKEAEIRAKHEKIRQQEAAFQESLDKEIEERKQKIERLNLEVASLDSKIDALKKKREMVDEEVENMNVAQLQVEGRRLFGP